MRSAALPTLPVSVTRPSSTVTSIRRRLLAYHNVARPDVRLDLIIRTICIVVDINFTVDAPKAGHPRSNLDSQLLLMSEIDHARQGHHAVLCLYIDFVDFGRRVPDQSRSHEVCKFLVRAPYLRQEVNPIYNRTHALYRSRDASRAFWPINWLPCRSR